MHTGVLEPGEDYIFTATVDYQTEGLGLGQANLTLPTNGAPTSGTCAPSSAVVNFGDWAEITCSAWSDDAADFPLEYQFGYLSSDGLFVALTQSYQSSATSRVILPAGDQTVVTRIRDQPGAVTEYLFDVTTNAADLSEPNALVTLTGELLDSTALALETGDLSSMSQLIGASLSIQPTGSTEGANRILFTICFFRCQCAYSICTAGTPLFVMIKVYCVNVVAFCIH